MTLETIAFVVLFVDISLNLLPKLKQMLTRSQASRKADRANLCSLDKEKVITVIK